MKKVSESYTPVFHSTTFDVFSSIPTSPSPGEDNRFYSHIHEYYEIYINFSGNVAFVVNGKIYTIQPGDIILTRPGEYHQCIDRGGSVHKHMCVWIKTSEENDMMRRLSGSQRYHIVLSPPKKAALLRVCEDLSEAMSDSDSTMAERLSLLFQIIAMAEQGCVHSCEEEKILVNDPIPDALNNVLQDIHQHLKDISSVADVCASQHLSKCTLERLFHRYLHITPSAYIAKQKLLLARALLLSEKHRESSVSELCELCGFSDYSHFIAKFRREFGQPPYQYRKKHTQS